MIDAGLVINSLRLLLDAYKLAAERLGGKNEEPDPKKLEEVIAEVETNAQRGATNLSHVEEEIDRQFQPEQAKKVKADLAMLSILTDPPRIEEFYYWAALAEVARSLRAFAIKAQLFRLRGTPEGEGRSALSLGNTAAVFAPSKAVESLLVLPRNAYGKKVTSTFLHLLEVDLECPLQFIVAGEFLEATSMGERYTNKVAGAFTVSPGPEKNWVSLVPARIQAGIDGIDFRLSADDARQIVQAMRADISAYVEEIDGERKVVGELASEVSATLRALRDDAK